MSVAKRREASTSEGSWTARRIARGLRRRGPSAIADLAVVGSLYLAAAVVRAGGWSELPDSNRTLVFSAAAGVLQVATNAAFNIYSRNWSIAAFEDLLALTKSTAAVMASLVVGNFLGEVHGIPIGAIASAGPSALVAQALIKLRPRWRDSLRRGRVGTGREGVIIVGAGSVGQLLARQLSADLRYHVTCFVDDDERKQGSLVRGIRVAGSIDDLPRLIARNAPTTIALALASPPGPLVRRIVEFANEADVRIRAVRGMALTNDAASLRPLEIEELLEREPVELQSARVRGYISSRRLLVVGAAGSIGSELSRQVSALSPGSLELLDSNESGLHDVAASVKPNAPVRLCLGDIRNAAWLRDFFQREAPEVVFHAAAYKHVPIVEAHPLMAIDTNVIGTANLLEAASQNRSTRFVFISSDKAVRAASLLGFTKRCGELLTHAYAQELSQHYAVVRFGNVLASSGSVVPLFSRQIDAGGPITITHREATRYFMTIREAAGLVVQAGAAARMGDLLVLDMGTPVSILELAKKMVRLRGLRSDDIGIEFVGLRPGEKLHEDLFFPHERATQAEHDRVLRVGAQPKGPTLREVNDLIATLRSCIGRLDAEGAVMELRRFVTYWDQDLETPTELLTVAKS